MTSTKKIKRKSYDEVAKIVSQSFNCTDRYVRAVIADSKSIRYKGIKPKAIRAAYILYLERKNEAICDIQKISASTKKTA